MGKNFIIPAILSVFVFTVLIGSSMSSADAAIYMKIDGIDGEATAEGHEKWIELHSFQFGVGRAVSDSGSGGGRETSSPSFSEIAITKTLDSTTPQIFLETVTGEPKTVEIHFVDSGPVGEQQTYFEVKLTNTLISGYSASSGGDRPTESLSLNFAKIEIKYNMFDKGTVKDSTSAGYDLSTGKKV